MPRLPRNEYKGAKSVAFTACCVDRDRTFVGRDDLIQEVVVHLKTAADEFGCLVPIYVFMPDHIHLMLKGLNFDSDPLAAMEKFKLLLSKSLYRRRLPKMQIGFYDHIIRAGEDWRNQAAYFAMNPVRAGLVENYNDYPYLGSLHGDVGDLFF